MRYSRATRSRETRFTQKLTSQQFAERIAKKTTPEERRGGILLVGGTSPQDLALRQAQAYLRLDQLPSYWSHAAIILDWPENASLDEIVGVEVTLRPEASAKQVPERNGVTLFRLSKYADQELYPHLAFSALCNPADDCKALIESAALTPNQHRLRYSLWDWLGAWVGYSYTPTSREAPLTQGIPLPAAAFCEYVYEVAGLDLTPGATAPNTCPEMLWSTMLYWSDEVTRAKGEFKTWSLIHTSQAHTRSPLSPTLSEDFQEISSSKKAKQTTKKKAKKKAKKKSTSRKTKAKS